MGEFTGNSLNALMDAYFKKSKKQIQVKILAAIPHNLISLIDTNIAVLMKFRHTCMTDITMVLL